MIKTIKWLWSKAEERATERLISELSWRRQYHYQQAEIAYFKDKYEPEDEKDDEMLRWRDTPKMSPKEHGLIANELGQIIESTQRKETLNNDTK